MTRRLLIIHVLVFSRLLALLDIPQYQGKAHVLDVCLALTTLVLYPGVANLRCEIEGDNEMLTATKVQAKRMYPQLGKTRRYNYDSADWASALALQRAWRRRIVSNAPPTLKQQGARSSPRDGSLVEQLSRAYRIVYPRLLILPAYH